MRFRQFIQLFIPPIYYKVKKRLFYKKEQDKYPMSKIECKGDKIIVIGNGPSLNKTMELYGDVVLETPCIMVNYSANSDLYEKIRPSFYLLVDPAYYQMPNHLYESLCALFSAIVTKTTWPMKIIMPRCAKGCYAVQRFKENANLRILFYEDGSC